VNADRTKRAERNAVRDDAAGEYAHPSGWSGGGRASEVMHCCCGATRVDRQIGLEATPDAYLAEMVAVFREVRRVLRPDGTCWVNMGDSYSGGKQGRTDGESLPRPKGGSYVVDHGSQRPVPPGYKPKDLLMMPARLALALQADGWWLRSDIIWHKPNPMPESVTDRPTSAHEHVFLLAKAARYFYDAPAIAEPSAYPEDDRKARSGIDQKRYPGAMIAGVREGSVTYPMRACRNVWTIATAPFSAAHFATFPPELASRCIRAGTSERGCCAACGAPWGRQTDTSYERNRHGHSGRTDASGSNGWDGGAYPNLRKINTTTGWTASCACNSGDPVPCTVLDPFAGAGTTLLVADRLQRDAIGIELNPAYTTMAMQRCRDDAPLFASPPPASDDAYDRDMRDLFAEAAE
jgi:DNA modification methylase